MLSLMLGAQRLGQHVLPVLEKWSEFEQLAELAEESGQVPRLAVRVKLATRGAGRWLESGGSRSKFGIGIPEVVRLLGELERRGWSAQLELLHFHLGSQISDIQVLKSATKEITQIYAGLHQRGFRVRYLDVGGGLGVNYGAGFGSSDSPINYSLQEYANAVVFTVKETCEAREVPEPCLVSESGRGLTAHHSVLVVPLLGAQAFDAAPTAPVPKKPHALVKRLRRVEKEVRSAGAHVGELLEAYHDAREANEEAQSLLLLGYLELEQAAAIDELYWSTCAEVLERLRAAGLADRPPELSELEAQLADLYLGNFSVFQSLLDHWAIGQAFPIMPLARHARRFPSCRSRAWTKSPRAAACWWT
jgi:arginine decarboxylase